MLLIKIIKEYRLDLNNLLESDTKASPAEIKSLLANNLQAITQNIIQVFLADAENPEVKVAYTEILEVLSYFSRALSEETFSLVSLKEVILMFDSLLERYN